MANKIAFHSSKSVFDIVDFSNMIMDQLNHQRKKCQFCDASIVTRDGKVFYAHKAVLAASSLYFQKSIAELQNGHGPEVEDKVIIELRTISSNVFECLLDMIYTSKLDVSESNIAEIELAANYLHLKQAATLCQQLLSLCIPVSNLWNSELRNAKANRNDSSQTTCTSASGEENVGETRQSYAERPSSVNDEIDAANHDKAASCSRNSSWSDDSIEVIPTRAAVSSSPTCVDLSKTRKRRRFGSDCSAGCSGDIAPTLTGQKPSFTVHQSQASCTNLPPVPPLASAIVVPHIPYSNGASSFEIPGIMVHAPFPLCNYVPAMQDWKSMSECRVLSDPSLVHVFGQGRHSTSHNHSSLPARIVGDQSHSSSCEAADTFETSDEPISLVTTTRDVVDNGVEKIDEPKTFSETRCPSKEASSEEPARPTCPRTFQCNMCDSRFPSRAGLSVHLRSHTGERPYRCTICGKTFTQLGHVQRHQKVHTGEKPFQCTWCNARVRDKASMHYHILAHKGIKPFQCDQCEARFTKRSSLVKHKNVHTGKFLYQCSQCQASFREKASLSRHKRCQHTSTEKQSEDNR